MQTQEQTLVVGIGNTIRGDDGLGIYLARRLRETLSQRFVIKELATAGLDLIETISGYDNVIFIDAIHTPDGEPGQVYSLSLEEFKSSSNLSSTHALSLNQIMELGKRLKGTKAPKVKILAVEAKNLYEFSDRLSPELEKQFDDIAEGLRNEIEGRLHCDTRGER